MKIKQGLFLSFALNLVLAGIIAWAFKTSSESNVASEGGEAQADSENAVRFQKRKAAWRNQTSSGNALPKQLDWRDVQSGDYKIYIENLRAIGCPEQTIRDIITSKINKTTASARAAIRRGGEDFVFWQRDVEYSDNYPKLRQERALERDKSAMLKELFGFDPNEQARHEAGTYEYMEWQYDFLTGDKRAQAREIQERFVDMGRELKSAGSSDPEVQRKVRELYEQRLVELATILTPDEVEEYDLCSSSLSEAMRSNLDGFHPSADEFRKIYRIKKSLGPDADRNAENEAIRQLLGEQRYAQYQRVQDYNYRELYRLSKARDLPLDTAEKVWEIKTLTENAAKDLRRDTSLAPEQRQELIRQNGDQAQQTLTQLLGEKNLALYRNRGGFWIQQLGR